MKVTPPLKRSKLIMQPQTVSNNEEEKALGNSGKAIDFPDVAVNR